jgi:uncharacterized protein (DUF697 family)
MAEELVLDVKSNIKSVTKQTKDWQKALEEVNQQIEIQGTVINDLDKDLIKLKAEQDKIPKGAWVKGMDKLNDKIKKTSTELKLEKNALTGLKQEQSKAAKEVKKFTDAQKESDQAVKDSIGSFTVMGVSLNGIKSSMGKIIPAAKAMFGSITAGIMSTGIGAFLVAIGALTQYFRDSEEGASKFKQITSQLGVVIGNVTDIVSDLGKSLFKLITGDIKGFKDGLSEVTQGVKDFGETTRKEMAQANQLEKDRLKLQKFEREAIVEKARTEKDMMELRLKARDEENFATKERLEFMREANKLAAEQLEKDLHVAKEKLRFQQEENSFSKSTQENLDAEAQLQAQVFQIERSNFSERKRLKSEEQALVKQMAAQEKARAKEKQDLLDAENKKAEEEIKKAEERAKKEGDVLLLLQQENTLALIEDLQERALAELKIQEDKEIASAELMENAELVKEQIRIKYAKKREDVSKKTAKDEIKWSEMTSKEKLSIASNTAGNLSQILGEETAAGKAAAIVQATIDTYAAAQSSFKAMSGIPVVGPALGGIAAAAAVASGLKNVQAITSAGGGGGGGGSISAPATAETQPPAPQMMSGDFSIGGLEAPEPVKAFVVTDEMTNSQNQLADIRRRATI